MSIPLDRLYQHLENLCDGNIVIYRWWPHGSKNLNDLQLIRDTQQIHFLTQPIIIFHDQEPLDCSYLESQKIKTTISQLHEYPVAKTFLESISKLRRSSSPWNIYEKSLLCHSEKNSPELEKFNDYFVGVYYWSHALIARDWFRFAEHDRGIINNPEQYKYNFLIYNRAWSGTREYRLKFTEMLIGHNLVDCSLTKFSPNDGEKHYSQHKFKNSNFEIQNFDIESSISQNIHDSNASADYVYDDYNTCGIEVILETLFDDTRHHLTEKTLRAIACGKPFILASTAGSLQYLKDYGFKTFNCLIDESYDLIQDPYARLEAIVNEMSRIAHLSNTDKLELFFKINSVAEYNKKLFFSAEWQEVIEQEFVSNFNHSLTELAKFKNGDFWRKFRGMIKQDIVYNTLPKDAVDHLNLVVDQLDTNSYQ